MTDAFTVNENSSFCLEVTLTDKDGDPLNPVTSFEWWVSKPKDVRVTTKVSITEPESVLQIVIPASANVCSGHRDESRVVIMRATSGEAYEKHEIFPYTVKALSTVPYT